MRFADFESDAQGYPDYMTFYSYSRQQNYSCIGIIWVKNSYLMRFYEIINCLFKIFRLYAVYNKHEMIKNGNQTREKSQALLQVLR